MRSQFRTASLASASAIVITLAAPAQAAASPRDTLTRAAFATRDKTQALALVNQAFDETAAELTKTPNDREALLQHALATGYRGQLKRSASDAKATRDALASLARAYPRDAEVQIAFAGWHLTAVSELGPFVARTVLGANRDTGFAALDRALALGGDRAFFPGYAALIRLRIDPRDGRTPLPFADKAATDAAPTSIDRIFQRAAQRVATTIRSGDTPGAAALAKQLMPFGTVQ